MLEYERNNINSTIEKGYIIYIYMIFYNICYIILTIIINNIFSNYIFTTYTLDCIQLLSSSFKNYNYLCHPHHNLHHNPHRNPSTITPGAPRLHI